MGVYDTFKFIVSSDFLSIQHWRIGLIDWVVPHQDKSYDELEDSHHLRHSSKVPVVRYPLDPFFGLFLSVDINIATSRGTKRSRSNNELTEKYRSTKISTKEPSCQLILQVPTFLVNAFSVLWLIRVNESLPKSWSNCIQISRRLSKMMTSGKDANVHFLETTYVELVDHYFASLSWASLSHTNVIFMKIMIAVQNGL